MELIPSPPELTATAAHRPESNLRAVASIAPAWHTVVLATVLLAFSFLTSNSQHKFSAQHSRALLYAITMGWEWLMVGYIALALRRRKLRLQDIVGGRWNLPEDALTDIALAFGFWIVAVLALAALGYALGLAHGNQVAEAKQKLEFLVPHGGIETGLFVALSASAGFCEEIIFRGYFQRQFSALTRSLAGGLLLQAILFGSVHAYEGGRRMILIGVYGAMFGVLALARNSLRPGMLAHFLHDASAGLALRRLLQ